MKFLTTGEKCFGALEKKVVLMAGGFQSSANVKTHYGSSQLHTPSPLANEQNKQLCLLLFCLDLILEIRHLVEIRRPLRGLLKCRLTAKFGGTTLNANTAT